MAQNLITKHIIEAVVKPTLDKGEREKLNADLNRIFTDASNIDFNTKETRESLNELVKAFQAIFNKIGDNSIDFEKLIKMPAPDTFAKLGEIASKQFWDAWNSVASGMSAGASKDMLREQFKQLEKQKSELLKKQKELPKKQREYEGLSSVVDDLAYMDENEFKAFTEKEISKMGDNIEKVALEMQEALLRASRSLSKMSLDDPSFDAALEDTLKKAQDVFRMSRTLEKHPNLVRDEEILEGYDFSYLQEEYGDFFADYTIRFSGLMGKIETELDSIPAQLKEIDSQLVQIKNHGVEIVDQDSARSGLKTLNEIEEAYKRILNSKKINGEYRANQKEIEKIQSALNFDPSQSKQGIKSLYDEYQAAAASGSWEEEYKALLKYVRLYEEYRKSENKTHRNKVTKPGNEFTPLYEQLKPIVKNAENMLRNIVNMAENKPLVGMGGAGDGDGTGTGSGVNVTPEDVANAKKVAEAEHQARIEAEAKAKAEQEAKEAAKQKRIEEEKAVKAAEKKKLADEAAAEASRKAADEAEREKVAKEAANKSHVYTGYRAIEPPSGSGKTKEDALSDWGGQYFSTNKDIAASYGENFFEKGNIVIGEITPKNPLIINANGLRWDEFDKMPGVKELFPGILELIKNPRYTGDDGQKYINEQAKLAGYDAVILENVQDALDGDIKEYGLSTTIAVLDDKIVSLTGSIAQLEAGTNKFAETISSELPDYYSKTEDNSHVIKSPLTDKITVTEDDDTETLAKENGQLEDKLELLRDIAEQYGINVTQKQRDRYEELNQKDMNEGLTPKEDERYWELGEQIEEADNALEEFGQTYDKIILKLANGKKVEILPNDKGLRSLYKFADGYGEEYDGIEVEDVIFERIRKEAGTAEQAVDALNDSIKETKNVVQSSGSGTGTGDASSVDLEAERAKVEALQSEIEQKNQELANKSDEKLTLQNDLDATKQQLADSEYEKNLYDSAMNQLTEESNEKDRIIYDLREQLANVKTGAGEEQASVSSEELKNVLSSITYNVKIAHDDADKQANKIAIDESALEATLKRVFTNVLNPHTEQNDLESKNEPWALEKTLQTVKGVLDAIQTNTAKPESIEVAPAKTDVGNVLATENTLAAIKTAVESINTKVVKGTKAKASGDSDRKKAGVGKKNAESYAGSQYFPEKIKTQTMLLAKFRAQLMSTGKLTDNVDAQIYELLESLKQVKNGPDFSKWSQQFLQLKTSVGITDIFESAENKDVSASYKQIIEFQKLRNKLELDYEKAQDGSALKQFYAEQLAQMDSVIAKQQEILDNEEYEAKLAKMRAEQERKLGELEAKAADKDAKKTAASAKKLAQREAMLGKAGNAVGRAENTWMNAVGIEGELPADFVADVDEYYKKLDALRKKHQELKNSDMISEEQKKELIAQTVDVNKLTDEISGLLSEYQRLSGDNATVIGTNTLGVDAGLDAYEQQLKRTVMTATNGKAQIKNFDAATRTLTYTVKTGKNEFTEYTAAVRHLDGQLVSVQGTTKKTETFLEATKRKMKEISSYMSGMALFSRLGQELRRGIQYVREIDLALTELKKVTDETEETYDRFLDTAAKTAEKVGSTIQKVVSSTADWARLGYSMKEAAEFAESTQILMNVSEFTDVSQATDTLISAVQAFGYTAETSMDVVDLLNTIGKQNCRNYIVIYS